MSKKTWADQFIASHAAWDTERFGGVADLHDTLCDLGGVGAFKNGTYQPGISDEESDAMREWFERVVVPASTMMHVNLANEAMEACESPIERALLMALVSTSFTDHESVGVRFPRNATRSEWWVPAREWGPSYVAIDVQVPLDKFRIDFGVSLYEWTGEGHTFRHVSVLMECDGHDFHERTKDQAKRDRSKDRALQKLGNRVFRFTGSEIWADSFKCAEEVHALLAAEMKALRGRDA